MRIQWIAWMAVAALVVPGCDQPPESPGRDVSTDMAVPDGSSPDAGDDASKDAAPDGADAVDVAVDTRDIADEPDAFQDTDADAECTGDADTDSDGLDDCTEQKLCSDPYDSDTDSDGLSDFEELKEGTDPCTADTDGDGVSDRLEMKLHLNPNAPDTFGDGTLDSNRWRVNACEEDARQGTDRSVSYTNTRANWKLVVSASFSNYETLNLTGVDPPVAAAVYGDSLTTVYGFLLSRSASNGRTSPATSLADFVKPEIDELTGGSSDNILYGTTGGTFETHDGKSAAIGQYLIDVPTPKTTKEVRESLLRKVAPSGTNIVAGLPSTAGKTHGTFWIYTSVTFRTNASGPDQAIISVAVAPESAYENHSQVRWQMKDLTNTTGLAEAGDEVLKGCEGRVPSVESPKIDFYWVIDQSGSMSDDAQRVADFADAFFQEVSRTQLDYRMGVTNFVPANNGHLYTPPGWTKQSSAFASAIQNGVIECMFGAGWHCAYGSEYGLTSAKSGLTYMLGGNATASDRIRPEAEVVTIFLTDDRAFSLDEDGQSIAPFVNYFPGRTTAYAITGTSAGCGIKLGSGYRKIAQLTGGKFAGICSPRLGSILNDIIYTAAGTQSYALSRTPISNSLSVFVDGTFIARDPDDGFAYFPARNGIAFFGPSRPEWPEDEEYAPEYIVVKYDYFADRCKESGRGAQNCEND